MRDPNRIPRILEELQRIWKKYPDFRLCQLLEPCKYSSEGVQIDLFYLEDDDLIARLKQFDGRMEDQKRSV